jgi:hypothetical protein
MGYTVDAWQQLEHDIRQQHSSQAAENGQPYQIRSLSASDVITTGVCQ